MKDVIVKPGKKIPLKYSVIIFSINLKPTLKTTLLLRPSKVRDNFAAMSLNKRRNKLNISGQAAVEYLLTMTAVLVAFAGVSILFSNQVNHYLSLLFDLIVLPF